MKTKKILGLSLLLALGWLAQSCVNDNLAIEQGEGTLSLSPEYRSDIKITTRAGIDGYDEETLNKQLVVYVEKSDKGLVRKFLGKNSIPESFPLSVGTYVIEGWTGDSVSASFNKKFFRGYKSGISITSGSVNSLELKLDIANVVVQIDKSKIKTEIKDLKVNVSHSRDGLEFDDDKISEAKRGYFMMPSSDKNLKFVITGQDASGKEIYKEDEIEDVRRGYLYKLVLLTDETPEEEGGALVKIEIKPTPIVDEYIDILPPPAFKATLGNAEIKSTSPVTPQEGKFQDLKVRTLVYGDISNLSLNFSTTAEVVKDINGKNLLSNQLSSTLAEIGIDKDIEAETIYSSDKKEAIKVNKVFLTFTGEFLDKVIQDEESCEMTVSATDNRDYTNSVTYNIVLVIPKVEVVETPSSETQPMAILAKSAELTGVLNSDNPVKFGFRYREKDKETNFKEVQGTLDSQTRDGSERKTFTAKLTGLNSGTQYEYKAFCDDEETSLRTFETESTYTIPYGDMETWSTHSDKSAMLGPSGKAEFWDTGNHGSMLLSFLGAGKNLTEADKNFISGTTVARLQSQDVVNVMAAGNLFAGEYHENDGMSGANLRFGQPYDGSHPSALKVMVNYRPGKVDKLRQSDATADVKSGENDHGQIFIAIASSASELKTGKGIMFDPTGDNILGYGEMTWKENVGDANALETVIIPVTYYERAKNTKATHIIIVCSASKYGDYFTGSTSSVMYVDDFELVYDDVTFE